MTKSRCWELADSHLFYWLKTLFYRSSVHPNELLKSFIRSSVHPNEFLKSFIRSSKLVTQGSSVHPNTQLTIRYRDQAWHHHSEILQATASILWKIHTTTFILLENVQILNDFQQFCKGYYLYFFFKIACFWTIFMKFGGNLWIWSFILWNFKKVGRQLVCFDLCKADNDWNLLVEGGIPIFEC